MASLQSVKQWDLEIDIAVVGFGLAGAVAAMTAHDQDPDGVVVVFEKMPAGHEGGNSRVSGQGLFCVNQDLEALTAYKQALDEPNPLPEGMRNYWVTEMLDLEPWMRARAEEVGMHFVPRPMPKVPEFSDMPGAIEAFKYSGTMSSDPDNPWEPSGVWNTFKRQVERRPAIQIRNSCSAEDLIQDPDTLEVHGLIVNSDGVRQFVRARRAVILACGGFENNLDMQRNLFGVDTVYTLGTPGNTGDGLEILQRAGADMWHVRNRNQTGGFWPAVRVPDYETAFMRNRLMTAGSWLDIAKDNQRFYNEGFPNHWTHFKQKVHGHWVDTPQAYVLPTTMLFDEKTRRVDPIVDRRVGWTSLVTGYQWSDDNIPEIEKGWISKADNLDELAQKVNRDPREVAAVVERYNEAAISGHDRDFGRAADTMSPLDTPPFYAVDIVAAIVCTTGGARRNEMGQVISWRGTVIPNLYEAGELGSTMANLYQRGSFLTECMISGRAAGRAAVLEKSR